MKNLLTILLTATLFSCVSVPENVEPVSDFNTQQYMGTWYEIARLDHWFERDLNQITATYELQENGTVKVLNRGFNTEKDKWSEANGKAKFVGESSTGHLKVSFFGPFYGSYVVFELGDDYDYAFITGNDTDYLWFLSRTPTVSDEMKAYFINRVTELGFPADELIFVEH
ncbi:lipocalin family protein [Reinekea marinisedimentorum]|uniref:Outer membrane lipoprotein Blc n=1 Tax=Reinekea marinisedimentorum TaxID=230495 RepID=A0A4R3IBF9_9GAMM|nr:lipocalin family protein [Reinekea marinisedimentorum]TCS43324.1 apolipoprotein D and lipocalin family protein [Reinekea marinisedimentorum]